jgi:transcriptional regulator with PAS, ATPase and Fis domain
VFLDEIGDMPLSMQVKLLRVIQEKVVTRVGGTEPLPVDVRIVAATNQELKTLVDEGRFRSDLYYRLNVVCLELPPLREHRDDIPLLALHFMEKHAAKQGKEIAGISGAMMTTLIRHDFPGNVRELENLIERAVTLGNGQELQASDLPGHLHSEAGGSPDYQANDKLLTLEERERLYIMRVLEQTGGNKTRAAEILGIDRVSLWRKIKRYSLEE